MRGKTLVVSKHAMPGFPVMTPGKAVTAGLTGAIGGAIVGAVALKEGNDNVRLYQLAAPETAVTPPLSKQLVSRSGAKLIPTTATAKSMRPEDLAAAYPQADYVLDVATTAWMGSYYPGSLNKYYVMHGTKMRLVERTSGRVMAEGFHLYKGEDKDHAPNYDGIFANNAAFLKAETKKGTDGATAKFSGLL